MIPQQRKRMRKKPEFDYEFEVVFDKEKETTIQKIKRWIKKQKPPFDIILMHLFSYVEIWYWEGKVLQTMSHVDSQVDDIHRLWEKEHDTRKHTQFVETGVFGEEGWSISVSDARFDRGTKESKSGMGTTSNEVRLSEEIPDPWG